MEGTKNKTSLERAKTVDLKLEPIDCNKIDIDLIKQVKIIPPRKIFKQYLAYSKYSGELPLPMILIIKDGKNSKRIKAIKPTIRLIIKIFNPGIILGSHVIANDRHTSQRDTNNN